MKTSSTMAGPNSPLSLPTALLYLLNTITSIHKGLIKKFSPLILSDSVLSYLQSCIGAMPSVSHMSAWILCHEHHLLYLLLRLAHKLVPVDPELAKHATLFHQVSLALVSWLLPGSEYLAHELMSVMTFSHSLLPEGVCGEPEMAALAELQLKDRTSPGIGALLCDALHHLPSIRGCYLAHLAHMESSVLSSHDRLTRPAQLEALDLGSPPPGLASFHDLYSALLVQYEAVSFGDPLFGCFMLLPLQRCYSVTMRLAVIAEGPATAGIHEISVVNSQLPIPLEKFTSPMEDSLPLLRLYFRALVTVAHLNAFIFSQDAVAEEVEAARQSLLRKTCYLTDEVLKNHLLLFQLPQQNSELGFSTYEQLPPIRARRLESIVGTEVKGGER
ncbi:hypothetical protein cypCar_00015775 [Cyprinus carpio]|nr:hypothetical protein cypCar_00015775 [Cyprinus carpio]